MIQIAVVREFSTPLSLSHKGSLGGSRFPQAGIPITRRRASKRDCYICLFKMRCCPKEPVLGSGLN
jgi:hypothetical protein